MYIWDVTVPSETGGDELALKQEMTYKGNKYAWTIPKDDTIFMRRTGVIAFKNLYLPCMPGYGIDLGLTETDSFSKSHTKHASVDCFSVDLYQDVQLAFDYEGEGVYQAFGKMTEKGTINQATHSTHQINSEDSNEVKKAEAKGTRAIKLDYLLNPFHLNDASGDQDEMNIAVYSDVYEQMFRCGEFPVRGGDVIDFGGLVVPCNEFVTVSLQEKDLTYHDGKTMLVPCAAQT